MPKTGPTAVASRSAAHVCSEPRSGLPLRQAAAQQWRYAAGWVRKGQDSAASEVRLKRLLGGEARQPSDLLMKQRIKCKPARNPHKTITRRLPE